MRVGLVLLMLVVTFYTKAQIFNFEKLRPNVDTSHIWKASFAAGFDLKKKTTQSVNITSQAGAYYLSEKHSYILMGDYGITRVNQENIFEQGYLHYRTVLNRKKKIAYEPFIQLQYDLGKGLKRRHLFGSNVRINFYNDTTVTLSMGSGFFYENENWIANDSTTLLNENLKSNNYVSVKWKMSNWANFLMTGYYQAPVQRFLQPRLIIDSNLQMNFTENFVYDVRIEVNVDRNPVVESGRLTYRIASGFRYSF